jgi:hypothetical protein
MAVSIKSKLIAAKKETVFNTAETLTDADVIEVSASSTLEPTVETIERDVLRDSFIAAPSIPVRNLVSGSITTELLGDTDALIGDVLYEIGIGKRTENGGEITATDVKVGGAGDALIYTLASPSDATSSATVKEFIGADKSITATGVVVDEVTFNVPTAGVATTDFKLSGCGFTSNNTDTKLTSTCTNSIPFIGKSATFEIGGVSFCATDVSITIANDVFSQECITTDGYGSKSVTAKSITGSFTTLFEDYTLLDKLRNNDKGSFFLKLTQGTHEFGIYIPEIVYTSVGKGDDSGIVTQSVEFMVSQGCGANMEPIIVGHKVV